MSASVTAATTMTSRTASAVRTLDLTKTYGSGTTLVRALRSVTLDIPSGRFTAIMGASGSGKSTLLHCITGLDSPTSGRVWIGDTEITHLDDDALTKLRRQHVGFVFQSFNLMPTLSAADNITLPLRLSHTKVDKEWFDHITGMLGITERLGHKPSQMSGGQQQRVAVARALANDPAVLLADEPTGNLDTATGEQILQLLVELNQRQKTIIMVTHEAHVAAHARQKLHMLDGKAERIES